MRNVVEFQVKNEKRKLCESRVSGVWGGLTYASKKAHRRIPERRSAGSGYDSDDTAWKAPDGSSYNRRTRMLSDTRNRDTSASRPSHSLRYSIQVLKSFRGPAPRASFPRTQCLAAPGPGARLRRPGSITRASSNVSGKAPCKETARFISSG